MNKIIQGDCLEELKKLPDNSVDSIVTDPPYELGFMGKSWDSTGIANNVELWKECLRVLKPGGHLLAFSGTRTYHRMASAIEDAGFEVRDMIEWVYGSGFPKSRNIGLDIDKRNGITKNRGKAFVVAGQSGQKDKDTGGDLVPGSNTMGAYVAKNEWSGWGTALKPAHEPICMARKPLAEKTVAENCLKYGTGGINIDESRVDVADSEKVKQEGHIRKGNVVGDNRTSVAAGQFGDGAFVAGTDLTNGRFPANLIHDNSEEVRECFPETGKSTGGRIGNKGSALNMMGQDYEAGDPGYGDSGNASRFFKSIIYQAKASKGERNKGCEGLIDKKAPKLKSISNFCIKCGKREDYKCNCNVGFEYKEQPNYQNITKNNHPTVKPIALMEYLIKMVTPKGGIVLDPFAGSGSTLVSAKENGYQYIGIERESEYINIINARLNN